MKKVLGIICAVFLLFGCNSNNSASTDDALADGVLTIGLECDYAPFNWTTTKTKKSDGAVQISGSKDYCEGYDIEVAKVLAKELDVELEVKKIAWDGLTSALNSGQIDVILAGMTPNDERRQSLDFSDAYFRNELDQVIMVRKDGKYANASKLTDFEGARITAQTGTTQEKMTDQIVGATKSASLPDYPSMIQALKTKQVDGYVAENSVAIEHAAANSEFKIIRLDSDSTFVISDDENTTAIAMKKGSDSLVKKINEALATLSEEDRIKLMETASSASGDDK